MKNWWKVALQGTAVCGVAFVVGLGCEDDGGAPGGGEGGEGAEAAGGSESTGGSSEPDAGGSDSSGGGSESGGGTGSIEPGGGTGNSEPSGGTGGVEPGAGAGGQATAGAGGSGEPVRDPDASVARFCNGISADGQNVTFILEVGEGDEKITFTADSFECAPADGEACVSIPLGLEVPVALYEQGDPVPWYEGTLFSEAQDQWLFFTILQTIGQDPVPSLDGVFTNGVIACDDTTYDYAYPPQ